MIYVVLGMHKSGTTLIAEVLHHSGISIVDDSDTNLDYDKGNKYERTSTKAVNHELLGSDGSFSLNVLAAKQLKASPELRQRMQQLVGDIGKTHPDWGFKDPRTCLTYPLWASVLPPHKLIVVYRSPREVWQHYRKSPTTNRFSITLNPLQAWSDYNGLIVECLKTTTMPFLVVNYERFMSAQAEFERLQQFVGTPLADRRKSTMYRSKPQPSLVSTVLWSLNRLQTGDRAERLARDLEAFRR
jgi:hypothetical protein